jgi:predicted dehydrogenase
MREKVRVGVVGVGSLGQHHARIYSELDEVEFVGLFDSDSARAAEIAAASHSRAFDRLEDLAAEVDAASVAVPTHLHREVAGELLAQGLHLLVEKPIASTTREAEELVAMAQERNLILQVGHIERFNPVLDTLEQQTGRPRFIEAHRLAPFPPPREGQMPRGTEVSVVLDLMIHDIEVLLHLVDSKVVDFHAVGIPVLSASEDIANVRLQFENGCVANVTASRISPEQMRKIRVFYDDAYISLDYQAQEGELHRKTAAGIVREQIPIEKGDALTNELKAFAGCVLHHSQPKVSGEHGAEALRLAVAITQKVRVSSS